MNNNTLYPVSQIFVWKANEHFRMANPINVGKDPTEYTLTGIEKDYVYAVRVAGYSFGGIGRKSPTLYFTLGMKLLNKN